MATKFISAARFVTKMHEKHGANRAWVWDVLEADLNIIKGLGCLLTGSEAAREEKLIVKLLNEDYEAPTARPWA